MQTPSCGTSKPFSLKLDDEFFCFGTDAHEKTDGCAEVNTFLDDSCRDIEALVKFTIILKQFKNAILL